VGGIGSNPRTCGLHPHTLGMDDTVKDRVAGDWPIIAAHLPFGWEELAVERGVVYRKFPAHMGTKVTKAAHFAATDSVPGGDDLVGGACEDTTSESSRR